MAICRGLDRAVHPSWKGIPHCSFEPNQNSKRLVQDELTTRQHMMAFDRLQIGSYVTSLKAAVSGIALAEFSYPSGCFEGVTGSFHSIALISKPFEAEVACSDGRTVKRLFRAGDLSLVPPDAPYRSRLLSDASVRYLTISTERMQTALADIAPSFNGDFGPLVDQGFQSPVGAALINKLYDCVNEGCLFGQVYFDGVVNTIAFELYQQAFGATHFRSPKAGDLSPHALKRVDDYIDEHMDATPTCADLAELVGLSETTFARSFKAAKGVTPYKYIVDRRLTRAKSLIQSTPLPLAQIAFVCGFASQSHMTDTFRTRLGLTPGSLRAS